MSIKSHRALTLLSIQPHKLRSCIITSKCVKYKACNICNKRLVEDEYHVLFTCSTYSVICENNDDILRLSLIFGSTWIQISISVPSTSVKDHLEGWAYTRIPDSHFTNFVFQASKQANQSSTCALLLVWWVVPDSDDMAAFRNLSRKT